MMRLSTLLRQATIQGRVTITAFDGDRETATIREDFCDGSHALLRRAMEEKILSAPVQWIFCGEDGRLHIEVQLDPEAVYTY